MRDSLRVYTLPQKVAPSFDSRISWFAFEEATDDWLDIATLAPDMGTEFESKTGRRCLHLQTLYGQSKIERSK